MEHNLETPAVFRSGRTGRNLTLVGERSAPTAAQAQDQRYQAKAVALQAKERDLQLAITVVRTALGVLGQRFITVLALIATIGIFSMAVYEPTAWRFGTAIAFAVSVLLPLAYLDWSSRRP